MKWINFLHLYQLSNADSYVVKEATEESYMRIIRALEENPNVNFTFNIAGCLINRWRELGYNDLIKRIKRLVKRNQIELVGSVSYHCLMPLVPEEEVEKQIKEDIEILRENFGKSFSLRGFFMPEMAYSRKVARIVKRLGFEWIILDEIAYNGKLGEVDFKKKYIDKASGLEIIFRSREFSNSYLPNLLANRKFKPKDDLIIAATDGELYGLRYKDHWKEFEKLLARKSLRTETISPFLKKREKKEKIYPIACNWESSKEELESGKPYFSWYNEDNEIQGLLWELAIFIYKVVQKFRHDENYSWARFHMSRALASCTFWWASAKDFSYIYGPYAWNPDEIERGLNEMIRAIRSLHDTTTRKTKIRAEKLYTEIKRMVWEKHWAYYWKREHWEKIDNSKKE